MLIFILCCLVLFSMVAVLLLPALLNKRKVRLGNNQQTNVQVTQLRLNEIAQVDGSVEFKQQSKKEIKTNLAAELLLDNPKTQRLLPPHINIAILCFIPTLAYLIYSFTGSPELANRKLLQLTSVQSEPTTSDINVLIARLESKLSEQPDNVAGWHLAANSYMQLQEYEKAQAAFAKLNELEPNNADILTNWADAQIMAQGGAFSQNTFIKIKQALEIDPNHINALWIAGLSSQSQGKNVQAKIYYNRLIALLQDNPDSMTRIKSLFAELDNDTTLSQSDNE